MYCQNCGRDLNENNVCPNCNAKTNLDNLVVNPYSPGKAAIGFIFSLIGLLSFTIPLGILGLIFSSLAIKEARNNMHKVSAFAICGLVISILDVLSGLVSIFLLIHIF